ncbi:nitrite/sulfite reductase [Anaerocolumna sp. AGMB13025]|uniref:nitrite/sulfite reductase n=1 Tax=Anaerocolumna sp. AGMB13025 TaxID=3039116 RepID=UPI00241F6554|nr:nitrite/sulfite reductase [Anaerocolumna sp. AGMB13025]WFR59343.1 nitrite/sulfite reductase [Anaerocolumna sp. AGMB13025]
MSNDQRKLVLDEYHMKLKEEIDRFRQVGHRFIDKEINSAEFKAASGGMGVYAQRGGEKFMIRLRIPSGVLNLPHLKLISEFAGRYQLENIHFTTRQAIQLHDLGIDEVCDIMEAGLVNGLYTRGSGGNFPRNVALSPLSGVEKGEAFDVTPYALLVGNYLMERITEYRLPRKLKISFSNSLEDTANCTVNDMGFMAVRKEGKACFLLYLAGGLGMNPAIALPYDEVISPEEVLYYVEALIRLFTEEGDYENKGKARLRYIPRRMGTQEFMECFKGHLVSVKEQFQFEEIKPVLSVDEEWIGESDGTPCLIPQKQKDLYTVMIHPLCGHMPAKTLETIIPYLEEYKTAEVRLSMDECLYIRNLSHRQAEELLAVTKDIRQVSPLQRSISCVGVPTCQIGIEQSQALCKAVLKNLKDKGISDQYLPSMYVSGCNNSCARHQVNEIGFAGSKKKIGDALCDVFELYTGGQCYKDRTEFGQSAGMLKMVDIPEFMAELAEELNRNKIYFLEYLKNHKSDFNELVDKYLI